MIAKSCFDNTILSVSSSVLIDFGKSVLGGGKDTKLLIRALSTVSSNRE